MKSRDDPEFTMMLARMFSDPRNRRVKLWQLDEEDELPGKAMHRDRISKGIAALYFFSTFDGRQPYLYDYAYLYEDNNNVNFRPTVICDSNLAGHLHSLVTAPDGMHPDWKAATLEFLRRVMALNYDFNSVFYLLEASSKHNVDGFNEYVAAVDHSFFVLHTIDREKFLVGGTIERSKHLVRSYQDQYNEMNFDAISKRRTARISPGFGVGHADMSYAVLLKMVLIGVEQKSKTLSHKLALLREFMTEELRAVGAYELILAAEYFLGLRSRFIPFQVGARFSKQRLRLWAAAWDLRLLRIPEYLLSDGDHGEATLVTICTADRELYEFGAKLTVEAIFCPGDSSYKPMISFDWANVEQRIGKEALDALDRETRDFYMERQRRPFKADPVSWETLQEIIELLESQLSGYCSHDAEQ